MAPSPPGPVEEEDLLSYSLASSSYPRAMAAGCDSSWMSRNQLPQNFFSASNSLSSSLPDATDHRHFTDLEPNPVNFATTQADAMSTQLFHTPYATYYSNELAHGLPSMLPPHRVNNPTQLDYLRYDYRVPPFINPSFDTPSLGPYHQNNFTDMHLANLPIYLPSGPLHYEDAANSFSDPDSPYSTSPSSEHPSVYTPWSNSPQYVQHEARVEAGQDAIKQEDQSEDSGSDQPYARLIYQALMQAPGHRMMLREIYEWFQLNTTKPQESGTNGWQNSIRHNLSMNQAFENDKSELSGARAHSRKANSVWILTESAIKNGVQSTTRYRKTGSSKRGGSNRAPAVQRQRSGAKGGRAACRAARLRRQVQHEQQNTNASPATPTSMTSVYGYNSPSQLEYTSSYTYSPVTPTGEIALDDTFLPLHVPYYGSGRLSLIKSDFSENEEEMQGYVSTQLPDSAVEEMLRFHMDSTTSG